MKLTEPLATHRWLQEQGFTAHEVMDALECRSTHPPTWNDVYDELERCWRCLEKGNDVKQKARIYRLPVSDYPTEKRDCITCGGKFKSQGKHNRMCDSCRAKPTPTELEMYG